MPPKDCPTYPPCTLAASNTTPKEALLKPIISVDSSEVTIFGERDEILVSYEKLEYEVPESYQDNAGKRALSHIIHYFLPTPQSRKILEEYSGKEVRIQLTSVINSTENVPKTEVISLKLRLQG